MLPHHIDLRICQAAGFVEDGIRHGDLADIVEQGAPVKPLQLLFGESGVQMLCNDAGILRHPTGVFGGVVVLLVDHLVDGGHRAEDQLLCLAHGGLHFGLHLLLGLLPADAVGFIKQVGHHHGQQELPVEDRVVDAVIPGVGVG